MVSLNDHASLLDFDTAHTMPRQPNKFAKIICIPAYMSPEQLQGKAIDYRADIYAWGVTAYELLLNTPNASHVETQMNSSAIN
jgi:serine/threonine protein kinase